MEHRQWQERDDHVEGYIYLIEAKNVTGIVPGKLVRRCKIGLTRNPQARLAALTNNQPPCDYVILRTMYVADMAYVEGLLHEDFRHCNIKLAKSREWFDLNPIQFQQVWWAFNRYEREYSPQTYEEKTVSLRLVVGACIALIGVGMLFGTSMRSEPTQEVVPQQSIIKKR